MKQAVTTDEGIYSIEGLPAGDYLVLPVGRQDFRPFGAGVGPSAPLPHPGHFFGFPHHLTPGASLRVDLDLARDGLGRVDPRIPGEMADARAISYGRLVDGRVARRACLGGQEPLAAARPGGPVFELREHLLVPGTYRVWLDDREKRRLSQVLAPVRFGETVQVHLPIPDAVLTIPVVAPLRVKVEDVRVTRLEAFDPRAPDASSPWIEWGGYRLLRAPGTIRLEGVPPLRVRALLQAPGCREAWSGDVDLEGRRAGLAQPVHFVLEDASAR